MTHGLNLLGEPPATLRDWNAVALPAIYLGVARAARDWLARYLNERTPSNLGKPLASLPRFQTEVGEIELSLATAAIVLESQAAAPTDTGLAKTYATRAAIDAVQRAVALIGNAALTSPQYAHCDVTEGLQRFGSAALTDSLAPLWSGYERLVFAEGPNFPEMTDMVATQVQVSIEAVVQFLDHCMARDAIVVEEPRALATSYMMALRGYYTAALLAAHEPPQEDRDAFVRQLVGALLRGQDVQTP